MSDSIIFNLLEDPTEEWATEYDLDDCFHCNNPWWVDTYWFIEPEDRESYIDELAAGLPQGYQIDGNEIKITDECKNYPMQFKNNLVQLLSHSSKEDWKQQSPIGYWKKVVCGIGGIMIWYDCELFTLNEFLLHIADRTPKKLFVGSIFEYSL